MRSRKGQERIYWTLLVGVLILIGLVTNITTHKAYEQAKAKSERYKEEHIYMTDRIFSLNWELQGLLSEKEATSQ